MHTWHQRLTYMILPLIATTWLLATGYGFKTASYKCDKIGLPKVHLSVYGFHWLHALNHFHALHLLHGLDVNMFFPFQHHTCSSNLHRHQEEKKTTTRCTKPWQAPQNEKTCIYLELWIPIGRIFLLLFGASYVLWDFAVFFMVPANVLKTSLLTRCNNLRVA